MNSMGRGSREIFGFIFIPLHQGRQEIKQALFLRRQLIAFPQQFCDLSLDTPAFGACLFRLILCSANASTR